MRERIGKTAGASRADKETEGRRQRPPQELDDSGVTDCAERPYKG